MASFPKLPTTRMAQAQAMPSSVKAALSGRRPISRATMRAGWDRTRRRPRRSSSEGRQSAGASGRIAAAGGMAVPAAIYLAFNIGDPATMRPAYDSGDNLHPNDAGYRAMADAIDLSLFIDRNARPRAINAKARSAPTDEPKATPCRCPP